MSTVYGLSVHGSSLFTCTGDGKLLVYGLVVHTADGVRAFNSCGALTGLVVATKEQEVLGHSGAVMDITVSSRVVVSAGMDRTLSVWARRASCDAGLPITLAHCLRGHTGPVWTVQVWLCCWVVQVGASMSLLCRRLWVTLCSLALLTARCACGALSRVSAFARSGHARASKFGV